MDDNVGSGASATDQLERWWANPTIRSWISLKLIRITYVSYAVSSLGLAALLGHRALSDRPRWVEYGWDFRNAAWTVEEHLAIRKLCYDYAWHSAEALGYGGSEGLLALGHTLPNNLPIVLRQKKAPALGAWQPFLPPGGRRLGPLQLLQIDDHHPRLEPAPFTNLLSRASRRRLATIGPVNSLEDRLMALLACLRSGACTDEQLAARLRWSSFAILQVLEAAQQLGLVDRTRRLTTVGAQRERSWSRKFGSLARPSPIPASTPYYPQQLRWGE